MKLARRLLLLAMVTIFFLVGCSPHLPLKQHSKSDTSDFKKATNRYVDLMTREVERLDNIDVSNYKSVVKDTDEGKEKLERYFKQYDEGFNHAVLKQKKNQEIYQSLKNMNEIYTHLYQNLHQLSHAPGVDQMKFGKQSCFLFYTAYTALQIQKDNLEAANGHDVIDSKYYQQLNTNIQNSSMDTDMILMSYASSQNKGQDLKAKDVPQFDAVKYGKFKPYNQDEKVDSSDYNKLADFMNKYLDDDSVVKHVDQPVERFVYDMRVKEMKAIAAVINSENSTQEEKSDGKSN